MRVKGAKRNPQLVDTITVNVKTNNKKSRIHNVFIVDASGSMDGPKYVNAIEGVNEVLSDIKKDADTENTVTVIEFEGSRIMRLLDLTSTIPEKYSGMGCGGYTPLNQAVGETLEYIFSERNSRFSETDKVLVNVFTDGGENSSRGKFSGTKGQTLLGELIKNLETQGFTVTFMGTNSEVNYAINTLNLSASNTLVHANTANSIKMSYGRTRSARVAFSKSVSRGEEVTKDFYTKTVEEEKI